MVQPAEHAADNRETEVRILPGRVGRTTYLTVGTEALEAEHLALNQAGEGSSPSGPTRSMHRWSSGEDSALVRRRHGFESHPVLSLFDNPGTAMVPMM